MRFPLLFRCVFWVISMLVVATATAQTVTLQVPISRLSHGFTLHYFDGQDELTLSADSALLTPVDLNEGIFTTETRLELTFPLDVSQFSQWWLVDDTTLEFGSAGTGDLREATWYVLDGSGNPAASTALSLAVPEDRISNALVIVVDGGYTYPVSKSDVLGGDLGNGVQSYGIFNAWAYPSSLSTGWRLVDLTSWEQAPDGTTNLLGATWQPLTVITGTRSVSIIVPDHQAESSFTLHTSSGSMQGLTPSLVSINDPEEATVHDCYVITGAVAVGESFWLTRDVDEASSPQARVTYEDIVANWKQYFPVVRNLQTYTFRAGPSREYHTLTVHHADGFVTSFSLAPWNDYETNYLLAYDEFGTVFSYYYTDFVCEVDTNQTWWVVDEDTHETNPVLMEGFTPYQPTALNIAQGRHGHTLVLVQADGIPHPVVAGEGYEEVTAYTSYWINFSHPDGEHWSEIKYYPATAEWNPVQAFSIIDQTTNEQMDFPAGTATVDLTQWFDPPSEVHVNVSVTRWAHELRLIHPNGQSFPVTPNNVQGVWSQPAWGQGWFTSYGYFDASAMAQGELDWAIYDVTTGELSSINPTDLSEWTAPPADSDGDGLEDWYEFIVGTDPFDSDSDDDGLSDADEFANGTNPLDADSDGDGMHDGWEIAHGFDPLQDDAGGDADEDGWSNVDEFRMGTDPHRTTVRIQITSPDNAVFVPGN